MPNNGRIMATAVTGVETQRMPGSEEVAMVNLSGSDRRSWGGFRSGRSARAVLSGRVSRSMQVASGIRPTDGPYRPDRPMAAMTIGARLALRAGIDLDT